MLRIFSSDLPDPEKFVVTLELVPGRESFGKNTDTLTGIAKDAFEDGRISAVSITDNPGGNPSLSPDVLGYEIFRQGLDVIVHFTCRDTNRVGMESRALQLARMGMKNILALTGDYSGKGYKGRGAPVFDLESVLLTGLLSHVSDRILAAGDPEPFFIGSAVSPFKSCQSEQEAQFKKLDKKIKSGSSFVITQLGYEVEKFENLIQHQKAVHSNIPMLASVYQLSPRAAKAMNAGRVPGVVVSDHVYEKVVDEWKDPKKGLAAAIERCARLGVVLKGLGYKGIHIGGIHKSFETVGRIMDRMDQIKDQWQDFIPDFKNGEASGKKSAPKKRMAQLEKKLTDHIPFRLLSSAHDRFFDKQVFFAPVYRKVARIMDRNNKGWVLKRFLEDPIKSPLLDCRSCGDCAIQHLAFICPVSGCPKFTRNGPCGGSRDGFCEVHTDRLCIWVRAWNRLENVDRLSEFMADMVPPRMWDLNQSSAWINFHLNRDHQAGR